MDAYLLHTHAHAHAYMHADTYRYILNLFTYFILDISQDLSQYQNDELLHESLHLLGRIFAAEENLFEKAIQTQVTIYNI